MRSLYFILCVLLSSVGITSCSLNDFIVPQGSKKGFIAQHADCEYCHGKSKTGDLSTNIPTKSDFSALCLDCHNYNSNHHPVNIVPVEAIKGSFPKFEGEIKCLTCHELHGGPDHKGTSKLLRGGPYDDIRRMCFECHSADQYEKINPHIMRVEGVARTVVKGKTVCLFCHEIAPDTSVDRANTVLFKAGVAFLCLRCHTLMHAEFFEKHFLVTPPKEKIKVLGNQEFNKSFSLPLVPRNRITCSTCHNPHQAGIIMYGPSAAGADSNHRLRDTNVCLGCH